MELITFRTATSVRPDETWTDSYLIFYQKLVQNIRQWSFVQTHGDMVKLVQLLKRPEATRDYVENILRDRLLKDEVEDAEEILEDSINLAVRLLLMVSTGGFLSTGRSFTVSGETKLSL